MKTRVDGWSAGGTNSTRRRPAADNETAPDAQYAGPRNGSRVVRKAQTLRPLPIPTPWSTAFPPRARRAGRSDAHCDHGLHVYMSRPARTASSPSIVPTSASALRAGLRTAAKITASTFVHLEANHARMRGQAIHLILRVS